MMKLVNISVLKTDAVRLSRSSRDMRTISDNYCDLQSVH